MRDMGKKSDPKFTIEREDVNGHYEPGNCKWISRAEQGRNRTNTIFVTYQRKRMKLLDVVSELGLSRNVVYQRLKLGWPLDVAMALPVRAYKK
jgi:transcriptional regulator of acetoin/glycerol metabolism